MSTSAETGLVPVTSGLRCNPDNSANITTDVMKLACSSRATAESLTGTQTVKAWVQQCAGHFRVNSIKERLEGLAASQTGIVSLQLRQRIDTVEQSGKRSGLQHKRSVGAKQDMPLALLRQSQGVSTGQ